MSEAGWIALVGVLLLATSLASGWIQRGPITPFTIYLIAGAVVGPSCLALLDVDLRQGAGWLREATEAGMVVSLFITGLKLRLPFSDSGWHIAARLAWPAMLLTVVGMTVVAHVFTAWPWPVCLGLAATLSPTDPVLASLVSVDSATDDDALRVALSGEAGMNDASALPFLLLGLALMTATDGQAPSSIVGSWMLMDVAWSLPAGVLLGFAFGWGIGLLGARLKAASSDVAPSDMLALALMALTYAAAEALHASAFLAVFAAGIGLRRAEVYVVGKHGGDETRHLPAEKTVNPNERKSDNADNPARSVGWMVSDALSFGDTLERLIAAGMVMVLGITCVPHLSRQGLLLALVLFVVVRPLAVYLATVGTDTPRARRVLQGWLGIRGIGSLNYLAYALTHGLPGSVADEFINVVVTVVVASVVVHGMTTTPLLCWRHNRLRARGLARD
ncbi:NhaP-type Na+/H+ or K+/H+ antiporter [Luteibacter sp. Sphag1AF]|uniref:cation:proton antiporter domain-containing protein n=1 Tax=Luteibacter sp. Sphag1AF TaxID=2587031 RepID=UPI00161BCF38|nr:cation:proton antiporter [Luteibacter sp. Sphag1AF]MBB3227614.1 NhaP-type Na+/H+ or K+/H+ antiporter [Luteibacter sp. Sphag1AF]